MLNQAARHKLSERSELGIDVAVQTECGARQFGDHDRSLFLQNERSLGVKNGSLGSVDKGDSQQRLVLIQGGFCGGHFDTRFDERRGMVLP